MDAPKALIKNIEGDVSVTRTGEGNPETDLVQQLVDGVNETPLGEPYDQLMEELKEAAAEIDTALGSMLSQINTEFSSTDIAEGDLLGTLSTGISSTADSLGGESASLPVDPTSGLV